MPVEERIKALIATRRRMLPQIFGNSVNKRIRFEDDGAVAALCGKPVTLEIELYDADLYAIKFE